MSSKNRVIKDIEGLGPLPMGTILRDESGSAYLREADSFNRPQWYETGYEVATLMSFPVTVLWEPKP